MRNDSRSPFTFGCDYAQIALVDDGGKSFAGDAAGHYTCVLFPGDSVAPGEFFDGALSPNAHSLTVLFGSVSGVAVVFTYPLPLAPRTY